MPEKETIEAAQRDKAEGKSPSTQAGEFVHEEIEHIREGKHGARSTKQAIAIGQSKARRAGVKLPPPKKGTASKKTRKRAQLDYEVGQGKRKPARKSASKKRSKAVTKALKRMPHRAASKKALAKHARKAARKRSAADRSAAAKKAAKTRRK